jgi:HSP20 family protein
MDDIHPSQLTIFRWQLSAGPGGLTQAGYCVPGAQPPWSPRINVYRCRECFVICVELAGIDRSEIHLRVEPRRVQLDGLRRPPAPAEATGELLQVLALEIDDGRCAREILLPEAVVPERVHAEQRNGLLWIDLPLLANR